MSAFYNENDPEKCAALEALMSAGHIAPGEISDKDIRDVNPDELSRFTQCHFFAGIGLWSVAARAAGIPDDFPIWSGSCPCQPFSSAGAGEGVSDPRHLWPHWFWLVYQRRPPVVVGEQVASQDGLAWFDLVSADMEGSNYSGGSFDLCSAGFGSPNIRQRLYMCWLGNASSAGSQGRAFGGSHREDEGGWAWDAGYSRSSDDGGMDNAERARLEGQCWNEFAARRWSRSAGSDAEASASGRMGDSSCDGDREYRGELSRDEGEHEVRREDSDHPPEHSSASGRMAIADSRRSQSRGLSEGQGREGQRAPFEQRGGEGGGDRGPLRDPLSGPTRGFWAGADWLLCRDPDGPKLRPVRPGAFCLAAGHPGRSAELRCYGDAINLEVATEFLIAIRPELEALQL